MQKRGTCFNCDYSKCDADTGHHLICCRNPPQVFMTIQRGKLNQPIKTYEAAYPPMLAVNWCGEWVEGEKKEMPKAQQMPPEPTLRPVRR